MTGPRLSEVDALVRRLTPEDRAAVSLLDLQRLQVERTGVSEQTAGQMREPIYGVHGREARWWWLRKPTVLPPGW